MSQFISGEVERSNANSFGINADQVVHSQVKWQLFIVVTLSELTAEGGFQVPAMQWKSKVTHVGSMHQEEQTATFHNEGHFSYY